MFVDACEDPVGEVTPDPVPLWQLEFFPPFVSKDGDSTAFFQRMSKRSATWVESQFPAKGPLSDDVKHLVLVGVQPMRATNDGGG